MRPDQRARRWNAPEVVQTSSMDCGPAALKCLLEGFRVPISYGRLREACQTDIDGTSIDTLELVAGQLGLDAQQVLEPVEHVLQDNAALPALLVVRHADTSTHFVVVWRRMGPWLQIMDPGLGRRWVRAARFRDEVHRHEVSVDAEDWRAWAATETFLAPLRRRLVGLGFEPSAAQELMDEALADPNWFAIGALDAAARVVQSMVSAGAGAADSARLVRSVFRQTRDSGDDIYALASESYWSVAPDATNTDPTRERLRIRGAVLLRIAGLRRTSGLPAEDLSPELTAALAERTPSPLKTIWSLLREDDLTAPLALAAAMAVATCALMFEGLLFQGLFSISQSLSLSYQRTASVIALLAFLAILLAIEVPILLECMRHGRALEARLRMALLHKFPRLNDRYFQSRPISDMADRGHNIHLARNFPAIGLQFIQAISELLLTFVGIALIAPGVAGPAALLVVLAIALPLAIQPALNERDLRARNQAGALHGFYLDALLGLSPIRSHRAEKAVSRQHESLLVEWALSSRRVARLAIVSGGGQALVCGLLAAGLLVSHFQAVGKVSGSDLLLVFWILKLPAVGGRLANTAHQYPAQRNALLRLLEPLSAPDEADLAPLGGAAPPADWLSGPVCGVRIDIVAGRMVAGGHEILRDLNLKVRAGEHVAIVGQSGAGKSSLLALLLGGHRLAEGKVLVDGIELDGHALPRARRATAWVDPGVQIWNRTLLDNLSYGAELGRAHPVGEVMNAARLRGVVEGLPRGLQSLLGEGGGLLSGGEGQRLRLGRALTSTDSRLILLDEPFRGMDREQRETLLAEARAWWTDRTLLCVTHDVSETRGFDRVLVVEDGRIVEDGAPEALMQRPSRYKDLIAAEVNAHQGLWGARDWRRIEMRDGQVHEAAVTP